MKAYPVRVELTDWVVIEAETEEEAIEEAGQSGAGFGYRGTAIESAVSFSNVREHENCSMHYFAILSHRLRE